MNNDNNNDCTHCPIVFYWEAVRDERGRPFCDVACRKSFLEKESEKANAAAEEREPILSVLEKDFHERFE